MAQVVSFTFFFFQAEDGIRDDLVTGVQTCALPICGKLMFSFELSYAGVFRILNVPQENLHPLVMIECPRLLFPFAREIIATSVRDGGFPPLMLDPVDFVGLYRQNMERQAAAQAAAEA